MNFASTPLRLILPEGHGTIAAAIGAMLLAGAHCEHAETGDADALLIDAFDDADPIRALALDDDKFDAGFVDKTLDRVAALQRGMVRLVRPGNVVVIGSDAYLGRWDSAMQAAASAAMVGIVRSLAMELAGGQVRFNLLALPSGAHSDDRALITDAAEQAFALLMTRSMTGEAVLLDDGNNLKFRQARRR